MKRILLSVFILFLFSSRSTSAVTLQLSSSQTQISVDDEYSVSVNLIISSSSTYYLRGMFHKPGSSSYCGYTFNGTSWFNGPYNSGWSNLLSVTTSDGGWNGQLKAKIDTSETGCKDSGIYNFKILRYTNSGNPQNSDEQIELIVDVFIPSPTPTLTPSSTSTPIPTSTKTPTPTKTPTSTKSPTPSKTPTSTRSPSPTKIPTSTLKSTPTLVPTYINLSPSKTQEDQIKLREEVLGATSNITPSVTVIKESEVQETRVLGMSSQGIKTIIIFFVGTTLISACAILLFRKFMMRN